MDRPIERLQSWRSPRKIYGGGVTVLGVGNLLYGVGQFLAGGQLRELSLIQFVMGATLVTIGLLVVTDSDRLSPPDLSDRVLVAVGVLGVVVGAYLTLGGLVYLTR